MHTSCCMLSERCTKVQYVVAPCCDAPPVIKTYTLVHKPDSRRTGAQARTCMHATQVSQHIRLAVPPRHNIAGLHLHQSIIPQPRFVAECGRGRWFCCREHGWCAAPCLVMLVHCIVDEQPGRGQNGCHEQAHDLDTQNAQLRPQHGNLNPKTRHTCGMSTSECRSSPAHAHA